ncbi:MAG TPA: putative electron transfer flavoprotein FixA [Bellilinea sp.]|nr:putative electron transfer flavoprotein FixA [Bellilinea sp.]
MKIVVCAKLAPDASDIEVRSDGTISLERAEWRIGSFDLQAIEAAVRLRELNGGSVTALSVGPLRINNSKLRKDLLSRGPDELVLVADDKLLNADTSVTARVLAAAVQKIGGIDLVLTGEGSSDLYFQQAGLQLGELLEQPVFNAVSRIEAAGGSLNVERSLENETEVLDVPLPAVLAVTTDIHTPRLPNMKEILLASRKPVLEWTLEDLALADGEKQRVETVSLRAPHPVERKRILIEGSAEEAAEALTAYLSKEGVL